MTNLKKIGLTALAGTLASTSFAQAGELSVSGNAIMEYQTTEIDRGSGVNTTDGFVMNSTLTFSGSGDLDNGMSVSMYQSLASGSVTSEGVTLDMGDMGALTLDSWGYANGITSIADKMPTAGENVHDDLGIFTSGTAFDDEASTYSASTASTEKHDQPAAGVVKTSSDGADTLGYKYSDDMFTLSVAASQVAGGGEESVALTINAIDGLTIGGGLGTDRPTAATEDDVSTMFATYAFGPVTVGAQRSEIDKEAANTDIEADHYAISFAVNENLSVSYGEHTVDYENLTPDEESKGFSASYTAGSISFVLVNNEKENVQGVDANDQEMMELKMIMAF
jgi:outer membrane protein OmpU